MWKVWDKVSTINGKSAMEILGRFSHLKINDTIYIKESDGRIVQIESKAILSSVYNLNPTLDDTLFISKYEEKIAEANHGTEYTDSAEN